MDLKPSAEPLAIARELILRPGGIDDTLIDNALAQVMSSSVDAADLYFQLSREESWALEDGIVKEGSASIEQGVGVRAVAGEKTGFAYSDEIVLPALEEASRAARAIAVRGNDRAMQSVLPTSGHNLYLPIDPVSSFTSSEKVAWLERVDRETRKMDPRVKQVMASVVAVHEVVLIANSEGHLAADVRPLVRFNVSVIVEQDGRREQGYAGSGGRITLPELVAADKPLAFHSGFHWGDESMKQVNRFISMHAISFCYFNMIHLTNWIINGLPERFPDLKVIWVESGLAWVPFMMQRLDSEYMMRTSEAPMLRRRPSEYIRDMYFTSQPLETSNLKLTQATMEAIKADTQLLFASDWPHWDFDLPTTITNLPFLSEQSKRNILGLNAARAFGFEVPPNKLAKVPKPEPALAK